MFSFNFIDISASYLKTKLPFDDKNIPKFKLKIIMKFLKSIFIIFIIDLFFLNSSFAQFKIIRDAEIEKTIFELAIPIIDASEINKQAINFYIVNDSAINAFVAGGQNIFINSGLITKFNNPETLIGVLAHEMGHISAGHLARSGEEFEKSKNIAILSYLLGIGAMISGSADAGMAIISGGSDVFFKNQMKYTRWQEESADKLAMDYLSKAKIDSNGLIELLKYFYQENLGVKSVMNEYLLSHPVSEKRISAIRNYQQNHQIKAKSLSKELLQDFLMARAKLIAFNASDIEFSLQEIEKFLLKNQQDIPAQYQKTILLYRLGRIDDSLKILNKIIDKYQNNGFLIELKAQILFENGNIVDAVKNYHLAIKKIDNRFNALIKISFANALLKAQEQDNSLINDFNQLVIARLNEAKNYEAYNPILFKNLAIAYQYQKDKANYLFNIGQYFFLIENYKKATEILIEAQKMFQKDTIEYKEIKYLLIEIEKNNKK